jgi:mercuric ion transport protein
MRFDSAGAGVAAWVGAALSSLCCLLPLAVIGLGLGSGAFMAVTMRYRWLLIPAGIIGVATGVVLYVRERRRCEAVACRMAGSRITLAMLVVASLVVMASIVLDRFPEFTSDLVARVTNSDAPHIGHDMGGMRGGHPHQRWRSCLSSRSP